MSHHAETTFVLLIILIKIVAKNISLVFIKIKRSRGKLALAEFGEESVLVASYIIFLLRPHFSNFNKRLIKAHKLYFIDTGLAAWLLGVREQEQLAFHAQRGSLFENMVVMEFLKNRFNKGEQAEFIDTPYPKKC